MVTIAYIPGVLACWRWYTGGGTQGACVSCFVVFCRAKVFTSRTAGFGRGAYDDVYRVGCDSGTSALVWLVFL